jgi:hypothetical protein
MSKLFKHTDLMFIIIGTISIISVLFILCPFYSETTSDGSSLIYHGYDLAFGNTVTVNDQGIIYSTTFSINVWLLVTFQLLILGGLGIIFGRNSLLGSLFGLFLSLVACVGIWLTPTFVSMLNPEFLFSGIKIEYGYILELVFSTFVVCASLFVVVLVIIKRHINKSAVKKSI